MDETAVSTVPTKTNKVIAKKGERRVAGVTSAERGITTTVIFSMSASGNYLPPTFIFPRIRMQESWKCGAPQDAKFLCSASGWSNMETCNTWMDHFIEHFKPTEKDPMLLILDGHTSHSRNFSMLEKANVNHVQIISMPPHTSHKLQPLDVAFMSPFKAKYSNAVNAFMKNNPGQVVTLNNICALVKEAFVRTATMETAENGFKATGIIPFNPNIFTSKDFAPSDALEALAHDVNEKNTPIISTRAETISSNQSSNEASLLPEDASTAVETVDGNQICVVEGTYSESYTVPAEEVQLCNTQVVDASVNISGLQGIDLIETSEDADTEHCIVDPNLYYIVGENGLISTQSYSEMNAEHTPLTEISFSELTSLSNTQLIPSSVSNWETFQTDRLTEVMTLANAPLTSSSISNRLIEMKSTTKQKRWDQECNIRAVTMTNGFRSSTQGVQEKSENKRPLKQSRKKGESVDLTSAAYRKSLLKSTAQRDLKLLKKTSAGRKSVRKNNPKDIPFEDVLCYYCGVVFSASEEGNGWLKCILCQAWFHVECSTTNKLYLECGNCN
ncbi:uncharacterized protein LOC129728205 isoform X2 [Wyeomyia smithii]|uniref:uncharacterized protein LOC129728205 isoform X2 n=1 Tax=Wyeomyia smithii TaxID=174621 RepID=UPI002467C8AF|nr:uncharacterized protein LOC129728205 isoform X2 [Wyeomyia smithii]